ncbi:hypothetical protein JOD02_000154 [Caldicoprobacter guelmensis]|uniref:hypothetical protein n=1 Tax=Caldicoprobacter guelmensis TaxID=1170224 RepID=UPI00195BF794|nr:hypothetical protein [Caldicoprobacter guelmensis]MBM7581331.1 hypothetical protein [Caldicoprobacter guelmensis]
MIQIDDAGSGSLIGGTCIGVMRVETGEFAFDFIPVEFYYQGAFEKKAYILKCEEIVYSLLTKLHVDKKEEIQICQGYMFETVRDKLRHEGYHIISVKIKEPLQTAIENAFQQYALNLGLPAQYVKYTRYPLHFHRILRWVYADYDKRHILCKTGWKSWKKYGHLNIEVTEDILYKQNYMCLKCGKKINPGSHVKVLRYTSNCPNVIYLHHKC